MLDLIYTPLNLFLIPLVLIPIAVYSHHLYEVHKMKIFFRNKWAKIEAELRNPVNNRED